jgi:hypothetical protein
MKRILLIVLAGMLLACIRTNAATDDKEGTIDGLPIKRAAAGWLGIEIKDNCFRMTFYNDKKKPVAADRDSAVLWWPVHYQPNDERTELTPTDNPAVFGSQYPVKAPHTFKLHITLMIPGSSDVETYVVDFSA